MEVIRLSGYTELEKAEIARRFLITKQKAATGLSEAQVDFTAEGVSTLIQGYTRESGVRNLEREIGTMCRKVARKVVEASVDDEPETIAKGGELVVETAAKPAKKERRPRPWPKRPRFRRWRANCRRGGDPAVAA
jgi:ATP-dependent Lon protease